MVTCFLCCVFTLSLSTEYSLTSVTSHNLQKDLKTYFEDFCIFFAHFYIYIYFTISMDNLLVKFSLELVSAHSNEKWEYA